MMAQAHGLVDAQNMGVDCSRKTAAGKWELTAYPEDGRDAKEATSATLLELVSLDFRRFP